MSYVLMRAGSKSRFTPEGGIATLYINDTGAPTVRGTLLKASSTPGAVIVNPADDNNPIGVMEFDGVPNGAYCWVVTHGPAHVLIEDGTTATAGYWARASATVAGRANITVATPPLGGSAELEAHTREIGHCRETVSSGVNKLALVSMHYN